VKTSESKPSCLRFSVGFFWSGVKREANVNASAPERAA
jgi:hypothetical protein